MTVTVVTTPGATNSNSYASVADLQSFAETRIHSASIASLTTDQLGGLLVSATRVFEQVNPKGLKNFTNGALRFPRSNLWDRDGQKVLDHLTVPVDLRDAVCEAALSNVDADRSYDFDLIGYKSVKIDTLTFVAAKGDEPPTISNSAFRIADYLFTEDSEINARTLRV